MRTEIIKRCFDEMAGFGTLNESEQMHTLQSVVNTLGSYPKPRQKGDEVEPSPEDLGAFLSASNVRNACKLAMLRVWRTSTAENIINTNLEIALTLLTE
ncbi:hypothetical protein ACQ1Q1_00050 [Ornithobacterium rhinotracheale]|nr:hypothetical protein [Ornithobacterium rhinotracheale]AIQ00316.1 hypothetical protein Q785_02025 [Ornithobacterium rhinotracheale ORT-UMN 88]KGB67889.1 hypothetical protein Q787_01995 [Ornithobacterium rhinotracheale H06-030791]MCK0194912.1 hypothetical protein [Ornithobacterium rhinotracheale]MCK0204363.1 hypothetical protein [Ornithobacterium rhinotracheale]UOH62849.1 hypothetical protein MT993_07445 [Ornithobacterium rhinotracheale]